MFKKMLGIAPQLESDGSFRPSKLAMKLGTSDTTDYEPITFKPYSGAKKKILAIFTERKNLEMKNGKQFSTGNHPVEALLPMLHLINAGFEFEIATPTGKPVVLEMWAMPQKDEHVLGLFKQLKPKFDKPGSLEAFTDASRGSLDDISSYAAIFIPGGHGAMLDLPENPDVGTILRWALDNGIFTISICHGPAAFLSTTTNDKKFLYEGYKIAVFPDAVDKQTPLIGYLPGPMPSLVSGKLEALGVTLANKKADDTCIIDRTVITGASPQASNNLGALAAKTLLEALN